MSEHFSLAEFLHSDTAVQRNIENFPTWADVDNLKHLADIMENIRKGLGEKSVQITSGYRCPALNSAVGGVGDSAHLYGLACDFVVPTYGDPRSICIAIQPHMAGLGIDQLINETGWVHLGLSKDAPRHQCLTINSAGTTSGF